jgi:hypothetical protein
VDAFFGKPDGTKVERERVWEPNRRKREMEEKRAQRTTGRFSRAARLMPSFQQTPRKGKDGNQAKVQQS